MDESIPKKGMKFSKKKLIGGAIFAVLLLIAAFYYFFIYNSPEAVANRDLSQTIERVSKIMVLPEGETPALATVADPTKLVDQPFFRNAQVGDKVLIYAVSKKAILYSPKSNKIVEVAPVNLGESPDVSAGAEVPQEEE